MNFRQANQKQLSEIKDKINKSNKRLEEAETCIEGADMRIQNVEEGVTEMLKVQEVLSSWLTDLEGRFRHENIRIYRVPEGSEDGTAMEGLLRSQLDLNPSRELHIERAQRALVPRPIDQVKP
ncbi:hypothetical protein AAFF_G00090250 [Aldrovandia affinis]|uniref:Uncharacterized protein n=1 Tax=Aldrovandia affinis TaxID=143900 RepID=A0AAD7WCD4_9TELE|nr:hypothetical protein AAFF_G00090250 [Aldrovandia affinis]